MVWRISTARVQAINASINEAQSADVASAATINLGGTTGNLVDVTGTTTITAITLGQGYERTVRFTGILTLTNGASLVLPGGANITTAAGDFAIFRGYASGVVRCVNYAKASGAAVVSGGGTAPTIQVFTSSGTWTKPSGLTAVIVEVVGGGGGGGGCMAATSYSSQSGGGGGGGYSRELIAAASLAATETVTVGAGGAGGTAGANTGSTGGTSSFGTSVFLSATGGAGGVGATSDVTSAGGAGGVGSGGSFNVQGSAGGNATASAPAAGVSAGCGGSTVLGGSVLALRNATSNGNTGYSYGGGGGGAMESAGGTNKAGGAGAAGIVIVTEYY